MSDHVHIAGAGESPPHHIIPVRTYIIIFLALLVLLVLTVVAAYFDLGFLSVLVMLTIAVVKAVLIILYFMHVRYSSRLIWVFSSAAFFWLVIMIGITMADYASRTWMTNPGG